jgi:predicted phage-related endonuclease
MGPDLKREVRQIASIGEWLQWRLGLYTASRMGALFGCDEWTSIADVVAEMHGERRGAGDNPAMRAGRILEPAVIAAINEERPELHVVKATTFHILPELRLGCTPDAFGGDELLVQCKTVSVEQWAKWRHHCPLPYVLQTLCELIVTDRARGMLAVMVRSPSFPLYLFDVPRHPAAEQRILDAVAEFWRLWDAGLHPVAQSAEGLAEMTDDGSHVDLSGSNELPPLLDERAALKTTTSGAEKRLKEIDETIKAAIGTASTAWLPGWNISWRTQHRRETVIPERDIRVLRVRAAAEEEGADVTC